MPRIMWMKDAFLLLTSIFKQSTKDGFSALGNGEQHEVIEVDDGDACKPNLEVYVVKK